MAFKLDGYSQPNWNESLVVTASSKMLQVTSRIAIPVDHTSTHNWVCASALAGIMCAGGSNESWLLTRIDGNSQFPWSFAELHILEGYLAGDQSQTHNSYLSLPIWPWLIFCNRSDSLHRLMSVYLSMKREIYIKQLAHMIMEAQ